MVLLNSVFAEQSNSKTLALFNKAARKCFRKYTSQQLLRKHYFCLSCLRVFLNVVFGTSKPLQIYEKPWRLFLSHATAASFKITVVASEEQFNLLCVTDNSMEKPWVLVVLSPHFKFHRDFINIVLLQAPLPQGWLLPSPRGSSVWIISWKMVLLSEVL